MESPAAAPKRYWGADDQEGQEVKSHSALLLERINAKARARKEWRQSLPDKTVRRNLVVEGKGSALPLQLDHPAVNGSTKTLDGTRAHSGEGEAQAGYISDQKAIKAKRKGRLSVPLAEENKGFVDDQFFNEVSLKFQAERKKKDRTRIEGSDNVEEETIRKPGNKKKKKKRKQEKEEATEENSEETSLSQGNEKDKVWREENAEGKKGSELESDKEKKKKKRKQKKEGVIEVGGEFSVSRKVELVLSKGNQVEVSTVEVKGEVPEEHQRDASPVREVDTALPEEDRIEASLFAGGSQASDQETKDIEYNDQGEVGKHEEEIGEERVKQKKKKNKKSRAEEVTGATDKEIRAAGKEQMKEKGEMEEPAATDKENENKEDEIQIHKDRKKEKERKKSAGTSGDKENREDIAKFVSKKEKTKKKRELKLKGFTLLGEADSAKKSKVQRVLPHWIANPTLIQRSLQTGSSSIDSISSLHPKLIEKLKECDIHNFFPVQKAVIPDVLATASPLGHRYRPRDICVSAPTGSGKTLAFVLPIVQALSGRVVPKIRALVLLPVQELAVQVYKVFQTYCEPVGLAVGVAVGLKPFVKEQSSLIRQCYGGTCSLVDILVATPGRLSDHLRMTKGMDISQLRYLVLDEADKMLATEGGDWITRIEKAISQRIESLPTPDATSIYFTIREPVQRLLFSATLSHDPEQLQHVTLYRPMLYTVVPDKNATGIENNTTTSTSAQLVGQYTRPSELTEQYVIVEASVKPLLLYHLLKTRAWKRTLVFTNSLEATHKLAIILNLLAGGTLRVLDFSSRHRRERLKIKAKFAAGKIDVLVSSDALARGLDIPDIEHVVSYDVTSVSTYVHRIGRTARAGKEGTALSLVTKDSLKDFRSVISCGGGSASEISVPMSELELYEAAYIDALAKMKEVLSGEKLKEKEKRVAANDQRRWNGIRGRKLVRLNQTGPNGKLKSLKRLGRGVSRRPCP